MLLNLREYHRPAASGKGLDQALDLLARPGIHTVPLAGGDALVGSGDPAVEAVVDLQGLGLDTMTLAGQPPAFRIGALVTRGALGNAAPAQDFYDGIIASSARSWGGSVQRNRATVGGAVIAAGANDPLVAVLLACGAVAVYYDRSGAHELSLADFLPRRADLLNKPEAPALLIEILVPLPTGRCGGGLATVGRTPADAPIVLAAATLIIDVDSSEPRCIGARLALGGVAGSPLRLMPVEEALVGQALHPALMAAAGEHAAAIVDPQGDFRGSAAYRRAMAGILSERALRQAWANCREG